MPSSVPKPILDAFENRATLSLKEVADLLGIDLKTMRGHATEGNISYVNLGLDTVHTRRYFRLSDVADFLNRMSHRDTPIRGVKTRRVSNTGQAFYTGLGFTERYEQMKREKEARKAAMRRKP